MFCEPRARHMTLFTTLSFTHSNTLLAQDPDPSQGRGWRELRPCQQQLQICGRGPQGIQVSPGLECL